MKNLIVCCDGTWNGKDNEDDGVLAPTNVFKLFNAIDLSPKTNQLSRYQAGVGTGGLVDQALGGLVGLGLSEDIRDCYQWLVNKYEKGDKIFLFGFSRGAFTARSLAGLIGKFGILNAVEVKDLSKVVSEIYHDGYRNDESLSHLRFYENSIQIEFIGVWDTVGALGIPNDKMLLNIFGDPSKNNFHDTKLGSHIKIARHALAIDEIRGSFTPTLWDSDHIPDGVDLQQIWFPGVHSDVGGGYKEHGLADCALVWMLEQSAIAGLKLIKSTVDQIKPNPLDVKHFSDIGWMKLLVTAPRTLPPFTQTSLFSDSAKLRKQTPPINQLPYLPTVETLPVTLDIYAKQAWNWTGIYLEANKTYHFTSHGQWLDSNIPCGPAGMSDGNFHFGEIANVVGTFLGKIETAIQNVFGNNNANVPGSKRVESADWFTLMGAVADGGNPKLTDGTHNKLTHFEIGNGCQFTPKKSGYLYCFANDAWGLYLNNRGFVTMRVSEN